MTFSILCEGVLITIIVLIVTCLLDFLLVYSTEDRRILAWLLSSIGFGVCLTILLVQNGLIWKEIKVAY